MTQREKAGAPSLDAPALDPNLAPAEYRNAPTPATVAAAIDYAARGWHVFPLEPGKKRPHKRLAPNGLDDATVDLDTIGQWWTAAPTAGIGIACGASGLVVLDVECEGMESIAECYAATGYLPETPTVISGGSGTHAYFKAPEDGAPVPSKSGLLLKIDLKANGGYVAAPPSLHPSGRRYEWSPVLGLDVPLATCPEVLAAFARRPDFPPPPPPPRPTRMQMPGDVWTTVARSPRVRARYERAADGLRDPSESGVDYGLACALAWRGHTLHEICDVIERSRGEAGLPAKRAAYYERTVERAIRVCAGGSAR